MIFSAVDLMEEKSQILDGVSRSSIEDPTSPFYFHHSDNPGITLVTQTLTGDNYASWSRAMTIAL